MKKIAVYCGAASGDSPIYEQSAQTLGNWLVRHQLDLVYGGGRFGLMGVLANTVLQQGGTVYGVIPQELLDRQAALKQVTHLEVVANMSIRKERMLALSDGCIALPGGVGTLEEIIEAISWARLGDNENPCVFYNVHGYYDPLQTMLDQMTQKAFLSSEDREKILFSDDLDHIMTFMANYEPPKIRTYKKNVG
ncbi:hypothetical protein FC83_GL002616 [Agrilactobacillus composti DSM 18527 = JCM 14202]|uniref:Cytokinin riboside 5'-monophosphate phosphoribohydrolase n=1 Tax=Agrilactobacillus composti DSM 18527 = JCM 14202 TaxID=1423734 RepID=X0PHT4_9LACO|nr:TIGR00730 family Rossman fold protein [Agrilactobacillus composti]KRM36741.1 hypothetical protein FC83_GL002616 [Agrilactobacillus composti DSM 18527 = JCM 14202]GAF41578.1 hypothetical protein JCM14202_3528 [Agrilactobacillus composti DSM 18527 = JCM 14202]